MNSNKEFRRLVQTKVDDMVIKELMRLRRKMQHIKRTSKDDLPMYNHFYDALTAVIDLNKVLRGSIR